jgi:hypothetical protein
MKRLTPFLYFALAVFVASAPFCAPPQAFAQQQKSLYQRLGGYDAIAAVTDDFVGRLAGDPQLKHFFGGLSTDSQKKLASTSWTSSAAPPVAPASTPVAT